MIAALDNEHILRNPAPGKWSIKDNIAHLARGHEVFIYRINAILNSDNPSLDAYNADNDAEFSKWQQTNLSRLLEEMNDDRKKVIELMNSLTEKNLDRVGTHPRFGRMNVLEWTEFFLLHEAHHLFTIFRLAHSS
jgi:uncharacterized damage-inducible protein DinB